jgi:16S rRNA A1518/A1519 N6-dimethyltransferase RsmA/KsgA/DIM1 with predicted DNA glycosylase/AP lyase activity
VRLDFDADRARRLADASALREVLSAAFGHRRKQLRSAVRCRAAPFGAAALLEALAGAGVEATWRAGQVSPEQYLVVANALAGRQDGPAPAAGRRGPPSVDR